jgi:phosphoribosylpyrophosphate synthetase
LRACSATSRSSDRVSGDTLFAQVENRAVVIVDDLISTGRGARLP